MKKEIENAIKTTLKTDVYKVGHKTLYNWKIETMFSNFTPRSENWAEVKLGFVVADGMRYVVNEIRKEWKENFFSLTKKDLKEFIKQYALKVEEIVGIKNFDATHFKDLHALGELPLQFRAVKEGTLVKFKNPILTIHNTDKRFAWLVNYLETYISSKLWPIVTASTKAYAIKKQLEKYAEMSGTDLKFVKFQAHDFSFRGMEDAEGAKLVGIGHLQHFDGSDNLPAILEVGRGSSVIATEHSIMSSSAALNEKGVWFDGHIMKIVKDLKLDKETRWKESAEEYFTYRDLLKNNPNGILSIVSDTFNIYKVCNNILPHLKNEISKRNGSLTIRPDSGDAIKVLFGGQKLTHNATTKLDKKLAKKGLFKIIEEHFGYKINKKGFKVLPIKFLWGDGITPANIDKIYSTMIKLGYASENLLIGVGSYTYQLNTRDTYGFAMKATYVETNEYSVNIYKDPITDKGIKKSATGLLALFNGTLLEDANWKDVMSKKNELKEIKNV